MYEFLHSFAIGSPFSAENWIPQSWSGLLAIGTVIGTVIAYFASRKLRNKIFSAYEDVAKVYQDTIAAQKELAAETQLASAKRITDLKEVLASMTTERDMYRDQKHDVANELNSAKIQLAEWESKPNFSVLFEAEKKWHSQCDEFHKRIIETQEKMCGLLGQLTKSNK